MPPKGKTNNPNGRIKGKPNRTTREFKEAVNKLLEEAAPDMIAWLAEIDDPAKRFDIITKIAEYAHPKLARTESKVEGDVGLTVNINYPDDD